MVILDNSGGGCYRFDELLDFSSDIENADYDDDEDNKKKPKLLPSPSDSRQPPLQLQDDPSRSFPEECAEEELEWLSNKDAFPTVDTFVNIIPVNSLKHESPISVLENSNSSSFSSNGTANTNNHAVITSCCSGGGLAPPVRRPRSRRVLKQKRGGYVDIPCQQWFLWCSINQLGEKNEKSSSGSSNKGKVVVPKSTSSTSNTSGRKCQHCGSEKTPQWRAGPTGPKTLCNACGVRYKSGRLCPEYRPASSPSFSSELHSNSHRKILEMKRQKLCSDMVNPVDTG